MSFDAARMEVRGNPVPVLQDAWMVGPFTTLQDSAWRGTAHSYTSGGWRRHSTTS